MTVLSAECTEAVIAGIALDVGDPTSDAHAGGPEVTDLDYVKVSVLDVPDDVDTVVRVADLQVGAVVLCPDDVVKDDDIRDQRVAVAKSYSEQGILLLASREGEYLPERSEGVVRFPQLAEGIRYPLPSTTSKGGGIKYEHS